MNLYEDPHGPSIGLRSPDGPRLRTWVWIMVVVPSLGPRSPEPRGYDSTGPGFTKHPIPKRPALFDDFDSVLSSLGPFVAHVSISLPTAPAGLYSSQYAGNGNSRDASISRYLYRPPLKRGQSRASPTDMIIAPISPPPTVGVSTSLQTPVSRSVLRSPVRSHVTS